MHPFWIFVAIVLGVIALIFCLHNNEALKQMLARDAARVEAKGSVLPADRTLIGFAKPS